MNADKKAEAAEHRQNTINYNNMAGVNKKQKKAFMLQEKMKGNSRMTTSSKK
jgi:hypothetical protein